MSKLNVCNNVLIYFFTHSMKIFQNGIQIFAWYIRNINPEFVATPLKMWQCPISKQFTSFYPFNDCLSWDVSFMNRFLNHNQAITFLLILIHRLGLFICFEVDFQYLNYSIFFTKPSPAYQLSFKIVLVLIRSGDSNLLDSLACT